MSYFLLKGIEAVVPLRPPVHALAAGLDSTIHGEHAYDHDHLVHAGLPASVGIPIFVGHDGASVGGSVIGSDAAYMGGSEAAPLLGQPDAQGDFD